MSEKYVKGDYNQEHTEIWIGDEYFGDVRTKDADQFVDLLNNLSEKNDRLERNQNWLIDRLSELIAVLGEYGVSVTLEDENGNELDLNKDND